MKLLSFLHGVQAMYEAHRDYIDLEIVAFSQTGVMIRRGTLDLLDQAVLDGAEVIGGLDPIGVDNDPTGQLNAIFAIAGRRGFGIDIHLHDRGETGAMTLEMITERTKALRLASRVAISHAFCMGKLEPERLDQIDQARPHRRSRQAFSGAGGMRMEHVHAPFVRYALTRPSFTCVRQGVH